MFRGDHSELSRALGIGLAAARELGQPRAGSEHLLLGLSLTSGRVNAVLAGHGATAAVIGAAVREAGPLGAGAAADRDALAPLGIDLAHILSRVSPAVLDRVTSPEPNLPLGAARARRRCARLSPPLGLDAQAAYAASLRLALARRERQHRPEHLALCLVTLDPGVWWLLRTMHTDPSVFLADLASTFPPPECGMLRRADRRIALRPRCTNLVGRYQSSTGRTASNARVLPFLIQR